ncbi:MAG: hypothetical protein PHW46_03845 [Candidatus Omnitrophica bacterium]|nr:hypothetical protein [Candidatus Omnitrophota bacterium]
MGQGAERPGETGKSKSYTLKKRVEDLIDFQNYGNYGPERSGMITGSVMEEVSWNDVGGNGAQSFLKRGVYQNTEVNINAYERLWGDYNFEGQVFVRKTDDRRIEDRKDLRLKQLTTQIYNSDNMLMFGDFYGDFSQFTLTSSLEGFYLELKPCDTINFKGVAARSQSADNAAGTFWRNVAGGKADYFFFRESDMFSTFRMGAQAITSQDDSSSVDSTSRATPIDDLNNTVVSVDGEITFKKYLSVVYELARSAYIANESGPDKKRYKFGNAFRVQPNFRYGPFLFKYLFYFVQPHFYTDVGSAMSDKQQHQFTVGWALTKKIYASFVENYYWDHLEGSSLTKRTRNNEQYITLNLRPFETDPDFNIRTYTNVQQRKSDDSDKTINNITITPGIGINDRLDKQTSYGIFYEYRGYVDSKNHKSSDFFNRVGGNMGREQIVFGKRFYGSANISMDFHDPKMYKKNEVTTTFSFVGQYNFMAEHMLYFGYNIATSDTAIAGQDYFNNMSYVEFNLLMEKKRSARLVLRGEHNRYNKEDKSLSYDESRVIAKVVSNF